MTNLDNCFLATPCDCFEQSFLSGAAEFHDEERLHSTYAESLGYNLRQLQCSFPAFVMDLKRLGDKSRIRNVGYCDKVFWLTDRDEFVGQASIRPELSTSYLITYGGHIGYSIRPSKRNRGYGTKILALALEKASDLGLGKALVTCDSDNLASRKIIERNGGVFESSMAMRGEILSIEGRSNEENVDKLRYWIDLPESRRRLAL